MIGAITAWSGSIASIPAGWALCNGSNGTPDLRDRFVIGVGPSHALNSTGGTATVTLTTTELPSHSHASGGGTVSSSPSHSHGYSTTYFIGGDRVGNFNAFDQSHSSSMNTGAAGNHSHSVSGSIGNAGSGSAHNNLPSYYALAFIMAVA
jgi:microcystin-dependent protein